MSYTGLEVVLIVCMAVPLGAFIPGVFLLIHERRKPPPVLVDKAELRAIAGEMRGLASAVARMAEAPEPAKAARKESRGSPPGTPRAWASR